MKDHTEKQTKTLICWLKGLYAGILKFWLFLEAKFGKYLTVIERPDNAGCMLLLVKSKCRKIHEKDCKVYFSILLLCRIQFIDNLSPKLKSVAKLKQALQMIGGNLSSTKLFLKSSAVARTDALQLNSSCCNIDI